MKAHILDWKNAGCLAAMQETLRGLEKESLRVDKRTGRLAQTPHPQDLGSALKHPFITTDYSEALIEFITPTFTGFKAPIEFLMSLHQAAIELMPDEMFWVNSMPCVLPDQEQIPIAYYGQSNIGRLKHLYRLGLSYRYGSMMQTIAGIHYNFSFSDTFWERLKLLRGGGG